MHQMLFILQIICSQLMLATCIYTCIYFLHAFIYILHVIIFKNFELKFSKATCVSLCDNYGWREKDITKWLKKSYFTHNIHTLIDHQSTIYM